MRDFFTPIPLILYYPYIPKGRKPVDTTLYPEETLPRRKVKRTPDTTRIGKDTETVKRIPVKILYPEKKKAVETRERDCIPKRKRLSKPGKDTDTVFSKALPFIFYRKGKFFTTRIF